MERTNNVKVEIDERMSHLTNKLYAIKHRVSRSFRDVRNALDNIHKDLVVVLIDKATGNIALVCKRFYASVINRELGQTITHLQILTTIRSSRPKVFSKKGVLGNFAKFIGKHLCQSLFVIKLPASGLQL